MKRITKKFLENQVKNLNLITGNKTEPYCRDENGDFQTNPEVYKLDSGYGGFSLAQMCKGGGERDVLYTGKVGNRELSNAISYYMAGIRDEQYKQQEAEAETKRKEELNHA